MKAGRRKMTCQLCCIFVLLFLLIFLVGFLGCDACVVETARRWLGLRLYCSGFREHNITQTCLERRRVLTERLHHFMRRWGGRFMMCFEYRS